MNVYMADGRSVKIESFYIRRTYSGMLEGVPTRELNESLIAESKEAVEKLWGSDRKIHVVKPKVKPVELTGVEHLDIWTRERYPNAEWLPEFQCFAWLSSESVAPEPDGSYAFLIWWEGHGDQELTIHGRVMEILSSLAWKEVAEDYYV